MTAVDDGRLAGGALVGGALAGGALVGGRLVERRLGPVGEIPPGEGRAYPVDGLMVAVFRLTTGALRAVSAVCPHAGGPLADGLIDAEVVICPLHQHVFELATGCSRSGQPPLRTYPVRQDPDGIVWVSLAQAGDDAGGP
ncbi:Rieske (2Fe-2S) protein [Micromonospora sp. NBC_01813]|uniref:Rieske (2Fe-2S) protein n=1 Tax=Micromonospora sp. NBC_01813 TaxID=2975988 RepID=UPI002DD803D2|nr:Rieske (2Fe-2S) protein [Micromonospora sp. NBC_01813]WSA07343.1 Rieske (2Fe-2S) protein [Micromonospora sp. NBC_01813]